MSDIKKGMLVDIGLYSGEVVSVEGDKVEVMMDLYPDPDSTVTYDVEDIDDYREPRDIDTNAPF